ncbi:nuclear transport factor 2 family protein [Aliidongia dinghuensis]|uniref:nuclear transport factor 2 family protein n=1 Tax=Aliidongia dinghuensis TaxID=1867774 RepID=UPI00166625AA|nr:nuclear transport factor 2 family protein [Aliidongia dinghuensis]
MASLMPPRSVQVAAGLIICIGLTVVASADACRAASGDALLSARLKRQTQEVLDAGQRGDAAVLARYLDPAAIFTNETGEILSKQQIVDRVQPLAPGAADRHIAVTKWALHRQGDVATSTFVDELTISCHGQTLVRRYQSTETWARRSGGWKMITSHTMSLPYDPAAIT